MKITQHTYNILLVACVLFIFFFNFSTLSAQQIELQSESTSYNTGDSFLVQVMFDTEGRNINSLEGMIVIPQEYFDVTAVESGKSFISLWTQKPAYISHTGEIKFSGGVVGGYSGSDQAIFTFVLRAKDTGIGKILLKEFTAYLNDGKGTRLDSINFTHLEYVLQDNFDIPPKTYISEKDIDVPESLVVEITQDPSIEENKYFVSFFAIDKDSGIQRYEVEENPWIISLFGYKTIWGNAQTPQVLLYQNWISTIIVRAIDMSGNTTEKKIIKPFTLRYAVSLFVLLLTLFFYFYVYKNKKEYNKNNK